jgi:hypothetical protein
VKTKIMNGFSSQLAVKFVFTPELPNKLSALNVLVIISRKKMEKKFARKF